MPTLEGNFCVCLSLIQEQKVLANQNWFEVSHVTGGVVLMLKVQVQDQGHKAV